MEWGDPCGCPEVLDSKSGAALQWLQGEIPLGRRSVGWAVAVQEAQNQLGANPRRADAKGGAPRSVTVCSCLGPRHTEPLRSVEPVRTEGPADLWIESEQSLCSRSMDKEIELHPSVLCCETNPDKQFDFLFLR